MNMFKKHVSLRSSQPDMGQRPSDALIELTDAELEDATGGYNPHDNSYRHRRHRRRHHHHYRDRSGHYHDYDTYDYQ